MTFLKQIKRDNVNIDLYGVNCSLLLESIYTNDLKKL